MSIRGAAFGAILSLSAATAQAQGWTVQPRVSAGVQDYEMSIADVTTTSAAGTLSFRDGFTIGDSLTFAGGGVLVSHGRFFADLSGQWSQTGEDRTFIFQGNPSFSTSSNVGRNHSLDASFKRREYNLTLGWAVTSQLSAFIGYKDATLDLKQHREPVLAPPLQTGDIVQFGDYFMDFSYKGAFVGTTFSVPVRSWGSVSVQASVARLKGSFQQRFEGLYFLYSPTFPLLLDPAGIENTVRGNSTGFNVGLSWTGSLGVFSPALERLTYTIGVDHSLYQFDTPNSTTNAGVGADLEEKNTRARLDLRYRFNFGTE